MFMHYGILSPEAWIEFNPVMNPVCLSLIDIEMNILLIVTSERQKSKGTGGLIKKSTSEPPSVELDLIVKKLQKS